MTRLGSPEYGNGSIIGQGTWMDEKGFEKVCIKERGKKEASINLCMTHHHTWGAGFMLRKDAGKLMLGKYLNNRQISWRQSRRLRMAVARTDSQSAQANQNRQDALIRLSAAQ